jgi:indole-3-glycerol phosphate synthase
MGASGVLLIAALLDGEELARYLALALEIGLSPLVEVHDAAEAHVAIESGSRLIGVNQRNLHSFEVDPDHAASIIAELPRDIIRVAESGFRSPDDVRRAADAGFDAVLVGEVFVTSPAPKDLVNDFATVPRGRPRGN